MTFTKDLEASLFEFTEVWKLGWKAWRSSPSAQLNYLSLKGTGYVAIRVPFVDEKFENKAVKMGKKMDMFHQGH